MRRPTGKPVSGGNEQGAAGLRQAGPPDASRSSIRMNRETLKEGVANGFGSPEYAREELRAEISAKHDRERVGVGHDPHRCAARPMSRIG